MLQIDESKLEPGARVAERYRLDRVLGEGGMGVVWDAVDEESGEARALKFIKQDKGGDGRSVARLLREARAASTVAHPNVARVFDVLELPEGTPFLVMERLEGETLKARLARVGKLAPVEATTIVSAIADGVRAAHELGIVHRDLKPDNVFILRDGRVKVLDFGIAKDLKSEGETELTTTGAMLGTLHYMAPEQVFGDVDVDQRADVWALGIVLYECLAGRRPTDGSGSGQVLKAIMTGNFTPIASVAPDVPKELSELVERMLSRDRDERPTLEEVLDGLHGRYERVSRRHPKVAAAAAPARPPGTRRTLFGVAVVVGLAGVAAGLAMRSSAAKGQGAGEAPSASATSLAASAAAPSATTLTTPSATATATVGAAPSSTALPSIGPRPTSAPRPTASASARATASAPEAPPSATSAAPPPASSSSTLPLATSRRL